MHLSGQLAAALAVSVATAAPSSLWRRADDPLGPYLGGLKDRGKCVTHKYETTESRAEVWDAARGSEFIDAYLNNNPREGWTTTIAKRLFPDQSAGQLDGWSDQALFTLGNHECSEFADLNVAGLFEVLVSIQDFHLFSKQYLSNLDLICSDPGNITSSVVEQFGKPEEDESPNYAALLSGALSIGAAASDANPTMGGALGALSGLAGIVGELNGKDEAGDDSEDLALRMVRGTCQAAKASISKIVDAVVGVPGSSEVDIPFDMKATTTAKYEHAIAYLFENGQWLSDHPTWAIRQNFDEVKLRMRQSLAWQLLRLKHQALVVINDASDCTDKNEVKDPDNGYCYGMMQLSEDGNNLLGGINDIAYPLWDE